MPIIILGFHRSGTSMLTRLLNLCGLYLGDQTALIPPSTNDNPEGYWEHQSALDLNDQLLAILGGSWQVPPAFPPQWETRAELRALVPLAKRIFADYPEPWGWKDPRTMITLRFWLALFPEAQIVFLLRNPLETARSLSTGKPSRDLTFDQAINLWLTYHQEMLREVSTSQLIITHYESYFYDPVSELRRVLDALQLKVSDETIIRACNSIKPSQKHYYVSEDTVTAVLNSEAGTLYRQLVTRAGPVFERLSHDSQFQAQKTHLEAIRRSWDKELRSQIDNLADTHLTALQSLEFQLGSQINALTD